MATKKSDATKERILEAATEEFAAHGIAGARVDRIAENASANKNLIYIYFGNKDELFATVLDKHLERVHEAIPFDARDLAGYAVKLFDFVNENPDLMRLLAWARLEKHSENSKKRTSSYEIKIQEAIKAQKDGELAKRFSPEFLLATIHSMSTAWTAANPFSSFIDPNYKANLSTYRKAIQKLVTILCEE